MFQAAAEQHPCDELPSPIHKGAELLDLGTDPSADAWRLRWNGSVPSPSAPEVSRVVAALSAAPELLALLVEDVALLHVLVGPEGTSLTAADLAEEAWHKMLCQNFVVEMLRVPRCVRS